MALSIATIVARRSRIVLLAWLALLLPRAGLARAGDAPAPTPSSPPIPVAEEVEHRLFLSPGLQFGASSQELSLSVGTAQVSRHEVAPGSLLHGGNWLAGGIRMILVAHSWSPAAIHGLAYLSLGAWGWEWWPAGVEIAVGGGRNAWRSYGLLQLSYLVGITSRIEAFATVQLPVGENVGRPEWLSLWVFGLRAGFDLAQPRRERGTRVEERERDQGVPPAG